MALAKQKQPAGPDEATKLDDFLCFAIYSANLAMNRINKPVLDELGLTYPQYIVLVALYEQDDQTVGGLGDKLFLELEHAHAAAETHGGHGTPDPATQSGGRTGGAGAPDAAGSKRARAGARVSQRACQGDRAQRSGFSTAARGVGEIARQPVGRGAPEAVTK